MSRSRPKPPKAIQLDVRKARFEKHLRQIAREQNQLESLIDSDPIEKDEEDDAVSA